MSDTTNRVLNNTQLLNTLHAGTYLGKLRDLAQGKQNQPLKLDDQGAKIVRADEAMASRFEEYRWSSDRVVPDIDKGTNTAVMEHLLSKLEHAGYDVETLREIPLKNGSKPATAEQRAQAGRYVTRAVVGELHSKLVEMIKNGNVPRADDSIELDNM